MDALRAPCLDALGFKLVTVVEPPILAARRSQDHALMCFVHSALPGLYMLTSTAFLAKVHLLENVLRASKPIKTAIASHVKHTVI